jgi:hypothetical protein
MNNDRPAGFVTPTIPIEMLQMLEETPMLDVHDDNGPGHIECPVCGNRANMRWNYGKRLDSPDDIVHNIYCPVSWAKKRNM